MPTKRLFSDWNKEELEEIFNLTRVFQHPILDDWIALSRTLALSAFERELLTDLRGALFENIDAWNEAELREYFIGPILAFVKFNTADFKIFSERALSGIVGEYELYGIPDAIIAKGHYSPKIPYFCFHEYKKDNEPKGDPAAQALSAMLAAQALNPRPHPMYGLYVAGKLWHFLVLQEREYVISQGFLADGEDIFSIFNMLKALKILLITIAKQEA